MVEELEKIAVVNLLQNRSIISLIGNVQRSSLILEKVIIPILKFHFYILRFSCFIIVSLSGPFLPSCLHLVANFNLFASDP